jgi:hypothetical protein
LDPQREQEPQQNPESMNVYEENTTQEQEPQQNPESMNVYEENTTQEQEVERKTESELNSGTEEKKETKQKIMMPKRKEGRRSFVDGLSVGLGIGCIATFAIMWITVFFTPQLPTAVTYENLLAIFIYPLIYLLALGLIALTTGIVREYYSTESLT